MFQAIQPALFTNRAHGNHGAGPQFGWIGTGNNATEALKQALANIPKDDPKKKDTYEAQVSFTLKENPKPTEDKIKTVTVTLIA